MAGLATLSGLLFLLTLRRRKTMLRLVFASLMIAGASFSLLGLTGCGGATIAPKANYSVTVFATDGTTSLSQAIIVTVTQ